MKKLSDLLYRLIQIYYRVEEVDALIDFEIAASGFFNDAYDNKVPAVTWLY